MKSPLPLTGAVVLKQAAQCMADARKICTRLGEHEDEKTLRGLISELEPIARKLHERSKNADA